MHTQDKHVRIGVQGRAGRMTLDRPEELNALSPGMVATLMRQLERWRDDHGVHVVVLDGGGEHGLSAGNDAREWIDEAGGSSSLVTLWRDQARLAAAVARFPKPVVVFMDGVVMGSGLGLAAHASHRIVEPDSVLALPEIGIGLVPGWGTTYLLARTPGQVGTHLALTGDRMDAADALYCGFADLCLSRRDRSTVLSALADHPVEAALGLVEAAPLPESELRGHRSWIDACYTADRVADVLQRLTLSGSASARASAARLRELPPTALEVVFRAVSLARWDTRVEEALRREFRLTARLVAGPDVREGIRSLADRNRVPTWTPSTSEAVSADDLDSYFDPLGPHEPDLALAAAGS